MALSAAALCAGLALFLARQNALRGLPGAALTSLERCFDPALAPVPVVLSLAALSLAVGAALLRHLPPAAWLAGGLGLGAMAELVWTLLVTCRGLENGRGG